LDLPENIFTDVRCYAFLWRLSFPFPSLQTMPSPEKNMKKNQK
jgi:hypothetical protein